MDARSEANLAHVEPDLCKVIRLAADSIDFIVICGLRTVDEEHEAVDTGHSETMHSRHLPDSKGLAAAVDVMAMPGGHASWDSKDYEPIAAAVMEAANTLHTPVEWGGDWTTLKDWGHFQLPWAQYP